MISCSSSLASSTPATSLNVIFLPWAEVSLARDFPKESALLPPDCIWRMKKIHTPRNSSIGDHVRSRARTDAVARLLGLDLDTLAAEKLQELLVLHHVGLEALHHLAGRCEGLGLLELPDDLVADRRRR